MFLLSWNLFGKPFCPTRMDLTEKPGIEDFLSLIPPGDVELYLADLDSLINHGPDQSPSGMVASLCLVRVRQQGEGHIFNDAGFCGIFSNKEEIHGILEFLTYFKEFFENPERSRLGTHAFDHRRYVTAAKECLQLCLCSHRKFAKGATEPDCRDKVLLKNKTWAWKARIGVHRRIRKSRYHLKVRQRQLLSLIRQEKKEAIP